MADKEAEQIKYATEVLRLIAVLALAMGGGSLGLLLGEHTWLRLGLAGGGLLGTMVLAFVGWRQHRWILDLIANIKGGV